jgi:hypothetical protein
MAYYFLFGITYILLFLVTSILVYTYSAYTDFDLKIKYINGIISYSVHCSWNEHECNA